MRKTKQKIKNKPKNFQLLKLPNGHVVMTVKTKEGRFEKVSEWDGDPDEEEIQATRKLVCKGWLQPNIVSHLM